MLILPILPILILLFQSSNDLMTLINNTNEVTEVQAQVRHLQGPCYKQRVSIPTIKALI